MRRIIGRVSLDALSYLRNRTGAIIGPIGRTWFRPLCFKSSRIFQGLREWRNGIHQHHALNEGEGLGSTYNKRKWMEAYYAKPDKPATGYPEKDMNNA